MITENKIGGRRGRGGGGGTNAWGSQSSSRYLPRSRRFLLPRPSPPSLSSETGFELATCGNILRGAGIWRSVRTGRGQENKKRREEEEEEGLYLRFLTSVMSGCLCCQHVSAAPRLLPKLCISVTLSPSSLLSSAFYPILSFYFPYSLSLISHRSPSAASDVTELVRHVDVCREAMSCRPSSVISTSSSYTSSSCTALLPPPFWSPSTHSAPSLPLFLFLLPSRSSLALR
eukprot:746632-Hanusia_phi.AAC.2